MPKINKEEYEVLKGLDDEWKWITRIEEGAMKSFISKPFKNMDFGRSGSWDIKGNENHAIYTTYSDLFHFIQWEDEEPYRISDLIKEYEYSTNHVANVVNERVKALGNAWKESEETEVKKDKLWAKLKIREELESWRNIEGGVDEDGIKYMLNIINQLDEPEALSQEWIDEHRKSYTMEDSVEISDLQNLLVPKQEKVARAYKDGYEKGKQHTFYKGCLEGLADKEKGPETVASVIADFYKSFERFKEVISMEVEELEE